MSDSGQRVHLWLAHRYDLALQPDLHPVERLFSGKALFPNQSGTTGQRADMGDDLRNCIRWSGNSAIHPLGG